MKVAVVVVDEAVLALTGYTLRNPMNDFYDSARSTIVNKSIYASLVLTNKLPKIEDEKPAANQDGIITIHYFSGRILKFEGTSEMTVQKLKSLIEERDGLPPITQRLLYNGKQLQDAGTLADYGVPNGAVLNLVLRLFGGGNGVEKEDYTADSAPVIRLRTNMNALAHFGPHLKTNEQGKATAKFQLPDSLTRYRVMAVANTVDQFGQGETAIIASLPLMIRQAPPRFLNFGDQCVLPVIVQNECDDEKEILVGMRGRNVDITVSGWKLTIPGHGRYVT